LRKKLPGIVVMRARERCRWWQPMELREARTVAYAFWSVSLVL